MHGLYSIEVNAEIKRKERRKKKNMVERKKREQESQHGKLHYI